ncbi:patatin-like phospholipase family protein [Legionella sp. PATHC038]|uniref:patatin-like phospholipase family protein n=1 Tax=Legionella sheltonii TaxID=2992041 RepID=UPI002244D767|nr:patatin-like phospholipase family protein [Legionella sp. PATHC038]MCW8399551.1 patatin-like phospholipase family protein [Legionella sp. PATHC038]
MKKTRKTINLGLQGGGAHGAFTWGVLDYLLEDGRLDIEGLSSTSAGTMNAAILAQGLLNNDRDEARQALYDFWEEISKVNSLMSFKHWFGDSWFSLEQFSLDHSPFYFWFEIITHLMSPYQFNPFNLNPMRTILENSIDFEALRKRSTVKLFVCATNVETGKVRIFTNPELTVDTLLASGCLPFLFQSVKIKDQYYWDGGYIGNPAIYPLIYNCTCQDVVIVHINPIIRPGSLYHVGEILNRVNEVSFNSSLMREMRAIAFVTDLIDSKQTEGLDLKRMHMHSIRSDDEMTKHDVSTKLNADWNFLVYLRDRGRLIAKKWCQDNFSKIGKESSVDIRKEFL